MHGRTLAKIIQAVKFTIAHELGHSFIAAHHHYLKHGGKPHGSRSEFVSDNNSEREADAFAGGLLLPGFMFKPHVNTGELSLDGLEELAREFETSLLRRAAGQSLPENPNRSTHSWENKSAPSYRRFS